MRSEAYATCNLLTKSLRKVVQHNRNWIAQQQGNWRRHIPDYWIPDYWIVNPIAPKVIVLEWVDRLYKEQIYQGDQAIISPQIRGLNLTAATVLSTGC